MPSRLIECLGTDADFAEIFSDASVLDAMLRFETALARAQARVGMIPARAADAIAEAAVAANFDAAAIARDARHSATPVIPFVKALTARMEATNDAIDSASAGYVHWGATSQDVIDTALVLLLRRAFALMSTHHAHLASALRALSEAHANSIMLARTLLQPAPPITFGYKAAAWFAFESRCWKRLAASMHKALQFQFGGASGTLAAFGDAGPALATELAKELDLASPPAPWQAHRDGLAAVAADCGIYTGCLAKIAKDISLLMQPEIGELSEAGGDSSAMPNKRNPSASTLVLAAATRVPGLVASFLTGMVQENERAAGGWQAEWLTISSLIQATGSAMAAAVEIFNGLAVNSARMQSNIVAANGSVFAEKASMLLAPKLGRTAAQKLVARILKHCNLREGLGSDPTASSLLTAEQIQTIDHPEDYLGSAELFRRRLLDGQGE